MSAIRVVAFVVLRRDGRFLMAKLRDGERTFYRPPGGGIERGERAVDAARREIREELGIDVAELRQLGVLENIFTVADVLGHEIVFVFEGEWPAGVECGEVVSAVEDDGVAFDCHWMSASQLLKPDWPVYPDGLTELLLGSAAG
jgi:8-oxo-dGTP pyrophosphatase MutT (NUDIX family)